MVKKDIFSVCFLCLVVVFTFVKYGMTQPSPQPDSANSQEREILAAAISQVDENSENNALPVELMKKFRILEENEQYELSRKLLIQEMNEGFSLELMNFWIQKDTDLLNTIVVTNTQPSQFIIPERTWKEWVKHNSVYNEDRTWDGWVEDSHIYDKDRTWWGWFADTSSRLDPRSHVINVSIQTIQEEEEIRIKFLRENAIKVQFSTLPKDEINQTLLHFDALRDSIQASLELIQNQIQYAAVEETSVLVATLKQLEGLKARVKQKRTQYLSWDVVSPYLAETDKLLFISQGSSWFLISEDEESFKKAISMLSFACHKQRLMECFEDVRMHFFAIQKKLKDSKGKEDYEELQVILTFQDSSDPEKSRGADAWWK